MFKEQGTDLVNFIHKRLGNEANTLFWEEPWREGIVFKNLYPRLYALELNKNIDVASKMNHSNLVYSFRREPRGGVERAQFDAMSEKVEGTLLADMRDRWTCWLDDDENVAADLLSNHAFQLKAMPIKLFPDSEASFLRRLVGVDSELAVKHKQFFEGVCYAMWWHIWSFRNKCVFDSVFPSNAVIFEDVVSHNVFNGAVIMKCRYWIE
ncbi:hypothetical protein Tco_1170736 [Tanacetum coccineum]